MIIKYIWHDRHSAYVLRTLCTVALNPFIMIIIFFVFFSGPQPANISWRELANVLRKLWALVFYLSFLCSVFGVQPFSILAYEIVHSIQCQIQCWQSWRVKSKNGQKYRQLYLCVWCARVLYSAMMFMTSFLILLDSAFFCFLSLFFLSISVRSCVLFLVSFSQKINTDTRTHHS